MDDHHSYTIGGSINHHKTETTKFFAYHANMTPDETTKRSNPKSQQQTQNSWVDQTPKVKHGLASGRNIYVFVKKQMDQLKHNAFPGSTVTPLVPTSERSPQFWTIPC